MTDPKREDLRVQQSKAVLVGVLDAAKKLDREHALDELAGLVKTAGVKIVGRLTQNRGKMIPATCLGKGKLDELKQMIDVCGADLVVFDNDLTPAQERNLEKETGRVIVDRSEVILDIFASRARTYESRLQVELAQLQYFRNRLRKRWSHLERIEGGVGAGRGPGEKQIETDRRLIDKRIAELKKRLGEVEKRRERTVSARREQLTVSIVGYTNAGKSTLMNALTGAEVYVADKLFATLDTRTRRWHIPHWGEVLLSDTVGFVRNLPHHLVASFRSTLEEARHADLLIHVVDAADPEAEAQIDTVNRVLAEIGVDAGNSLIVLNKMDRVKDRGIVDVLRRRFDDSVSISAATGQGLDRLAEAVAARLANGYADVEIETGAGNGKLFAYLAERAEIKSREYFDSRVKLVCRIPKVLADRLNEDGTVVTWPNGSHGPHAEEEVSHNGHRPHDEPVSPQAH
ncbi:MAG TPA: GTPase HflX [Planctomycetaceae bacterium]|nr:GTPase HflX [Planctomycetaceae bacterium]